MKWIGGIIFHVFSNALALYAASQYVPGFHIDTHITEVLIAAGILTLINTFVRPVLKLFLGPFIVLTFGLFTIVLNAMLLLILDFVSPALTIEGYAALLWGTLLIGVVNLIVGLAGKAFFHSHE